MKIFIDNGHGISTKGKCSPDGAFREYKWTREIARAIVASLKSLGYDAELLVPEDGDIPLAERCARVNAICDRLGTKNVLLVSIHNNAAGADGKWKSAGGWCAYTTPGFTLSDKLASALYASAEKNLKDYINKFEIAKAYGEYDSKQRPIRTDYSDKDPDLEASFYILRVSKCPAVLTESMFQDNIADVRYLLSAEGKTAITKLHVDGIENYIKSL